MKKTAIALLAWFVSSASLAATTKQSSRSDRRLAATPWQKITHPVPGAAQSIGSFANGCIIGADTLPVQSDNYQVMRTDQRRYFGHPDLVMFIQRLSHQAQQRGLGTVLIGDMGMPAGGRFNGGHASHQTGLDVDIFLQLPKTRWSQAQLLRPQALDLVSRDGKHVVPSRWSSDIASLIKLAAQDNDVTRIFVNPAIKQQLCLDAGNDRDWLRKVRPWFQHRAHMLRPWFQHRARAYARAFTLPCRQPGVRRSTFTPAGRWMRR
ncbi:Murein endopeptidase [Salmonella enterica subsp. enterica serovar Montevideo str. S5-403]|uniref:Murein endopeptidase n=1 Tax=Salmonella enterica subsp. enterica serovar Montevideo str. S5-403 TaxID=913242 RepID=G5Q5G7_SALMO|nr:Murein endopeptidase [Salmonella enterica subsp. enterica serovar Montevideo str. S5-403]